MPDEGKQDSIAVGGDSRPARPALAADRARRSSSSRRAVLLSHATLWPHGDAWFVLLLVGGGDPLDHAPRDRSRANDADATPSSPRRTRGVSAACSGIAVVIASLIALVLIAAAIFASIVHVHLGRGVGDRTYAVAVRRPPGRATGSASATCGSTCSNVQLPAGETHVKRASTSAGSRRRAAGRRASRERRRGVRRRHTCSATRGRARRRPTLDENGARVLVLDAHVGAGELYVERAVR